MNVKTIIIILVLIFLISQRKVNDYSEIEQKNKNIKKNIKKTNKKNVNKPIQKIANEPTHGFKNVYGQTLERCRKFNDDYRGSWDSLGLCSEQGVNTGLHQICFNLNSQTSNFSYATGQSNWSEGRISNSRPENNHCMCLGAWSLYKARQNEKQINRTNNELQCKSIPDTVFLDEYVGKWDVWNGNELPNQVVDGMDELVNQCIVDADNEDQKKYLINKYCQLASKKNELKTYTYKQYCNNLIDLTNLKPTNNLSSEPLVINSKIEQKQFDPMFLNPKDAKAASKSSTIHLAVPGLMPAPPDYWKNYPIHNQVFYMPNDKKPHFHGDAPHHAAKFDINGVWLMSQNNYVSVRGKQIEQFRGKKGIINFNQGLANTPVETWIHWRIPYDEKEYPSLKVKKDSIIWWDFTSMHNLMLINNENDYNNNVFNENNSVKISTDQKDKETLVTIMDTVGTFYFACTVMNHAQQGHKIKIIVV